MAKARVRGKVKGDVAERFCHRHPTRSARRKCFRCERPLCPECQIHEAGHIFCSHRCAGLQRRREAWERLKAWNRTALAGGWFRALFYIGLLLMGAAAAVISFNLHWFVPYPEREGPLAHASRNQVPHLRTETPDWTSPGPVVVEAPRSGSSSRQNRITVAGSAPPEAMVGLYVNDEKVAVQMALDGKWRFDGVPLTAPFNTLQARYFDNLGNSSFSKTATVSLETAPARPPAPAAPAPEVVTLAGMDLVRAPQGERRVLLTFDGGSNANSTPQILRALKRHGIRATLFLTGEYIQKYPELVRQMVREGHLVGNHTFSHPHLTTYSFNGRHGTLAGVTAGFLKDQLGRAAEAFRSTAGMEMDPYWRAPFGEANRDIVSWAYAGGYRHVSWTPHLDTLDWVADRSSPLYKGPEEILRKLLSRADSAPGGVDGGIILMHLGTEREGEQEAHLILEPLIGQLQSRGYSFVDVASAWPGEGK